MKSIPTLLAIAALSFACRKTEIVATKDNADAKHGAAPAKDADLSSGADSSYFPLVEGARYEYDVQFQGNASQATRIVRTANTPVGRVFYFVAEKVDDDNPIIGSDSFGLGAYRVTDSAIETGTAFWQDELTKVSAMQTALRLPLEEGATTKLDGGEHRLEMRVIGRETVNVPAGTFVTVRIDQREIWPDNTHEGAVWLARGIGTVKRVYTTGRTEVLRRVQFPSTHP